MTDIQNSFISCYPGTTIELREGVVNFLDSYDHKFWTGGGFTGREIKRVTGEDMTLFTNWENRFFLRLPANRLFDRKHACCLFLFNALRHATPLEDIARLLLTIRLDTASVPEILPIFSYDKIYDVLCRIAALCKDGPLTGPELEGHIDALLKEDNAERAVMAKRAFLIIALTYQSACFRQHALALLEKYRYDTEYLDEFYPVNLKSASDPRRKRIRHLTRSCIDPMY